MFWSWGAPPTPPASVSFSGDGLGGKIHLIVGSQVKNGERERRKDLSIKAID